MLASILDRILIIVILDEHINAVEKGMISSVRELRSRRIDHGRQVP